MLEPTDRVIAKTLLRVMRKIVQDANISRLDGAILLATYTEQVANGNKELIQSIGMLLRETMEEESAEAAGLASSTVAPPWYEDAGSGA